MTKAALFTIGLAALLSFPVVVPAQDNSTAIAVDEAVLRQAKTIVLRQKLSEARATAQRDEVAAAAKLYQESCALAQQIGSGVDAETAQAVAGLSATRLALARDAQSRGDLREADVQVQQVVKLGQAFKVPPDLTEALAFKKQNDEMLAASQGLRPSEAVLDQRAGITAKKVEAATLVQDGKLFYEMGKLPEAEAKLREALRVDPDNSAAYYYLNTIKQSEIARSFSQHSLDTQTRMEQVEKQWVLPTQKVTDPNRPNSYATNTLIYTGPGRQAIMAKLDRFRMDFSTPENGMPLSEVQRILNETCKRLDLPDHKGINFLINPNADKSGQPVASDAQGRGNAAGAFANRGPAAPQFDPATGLPMATPGAGPAEGGETVEVGSYMIKIPNLTDVRLADVLEAIVLVSDHPLKFSIQDFAVVFQAKGPEQVVLSIREFKVDPNTFYSGLSSVTSQSFGTSGGNNNSSGGNGGNGSGGNSSRNNNSGGNNGGNNNNNNGGNNSGGGVVGIVDPFGGGGGGRGGRNNNNNNNNNAGNNNQRGNANGNSQNGGGGGLQFVTQVSDAQTPSESAIAFFGALGVNLQQPAGKAVFFNDKAGILLVRATEQDLDIIERAIQTMNQVSPQVHIKARFIEVQQTDSKAIGFDWSVGQFNVGRQMSGTAGTDPSATVAPSVANPAGVFPGLAGPAVSPNATTDQLLTGGLRNSGPVIGTLTGILTDPNFRVALHMLEQRGGFENLAEPEATTTSGRQVQMKATQTTSIITDFQFDNGSSANNVNAGNGNGNGNGNGAGGNVINQAGVAAIIPNTESVETGPVLDVVPYVLSDGYTINMALIPSLTEFDGYDAVPSIPGYNPGTTIGNLNGTTLPVVLPKFTVRQVVTTVNVWDNQTVVLGGLISSQISTTKDKVPVIGDLPLLGRLFQSQSKTALKKNLMIFVTATVLDPAGNRVHSDDDLPFAQTKVPVQAEGAGQFVPLPATNP